jgi:hypothetical protein
MSSVFDTIRPPETATLPPPFQNVGDERRSIIPEKQANRQLFEETANLILRYSTDPLETDVDGHFLIPDNEIREHLAAETAEMLNRDALTCLLLMLEKEVHMEDRFLKVGSYRFVFPPLRQLNNLYLGPVQTNEFLADVHMAMKEELTKNKATVLHTHSKGGAFLVDFTNGAPVPEEIPMNNMEAKLASIETRTLRILVEHISKRLEHLYAKLKDEDSYDILENILRLEDLQQHLESGEKTVKIALGFENIKSKDPEQGFWAIRNSECAANIASLELNGGTNGNGKARHSVIAKQYTDEQLMYRLVTAVQSLGQLLGQDGDVKPEWREFFQINPRTGYINMKREMIETYRKKDTFYESESYSAMTEEQKRQFDENMEFFQSYYNTINLVDVIKDFTAENFARHLSKSAERANLVKKAIFTLEKNDFSSTEARKTLVDLSDELEISLKDTGKGTIGTTRQLIKALLDANDAVLVFCDNIGFGGLNQSSYENSATKLIDLLEISDKEWEEADGNTAAVEALIKKRTAAIKTKPEFRHAMLEIGDTGTKQIRRNEEILKNTFGGDAYINADGGDETSVLYKKSEGCEYPDTTPSLEKALLEVSINCRIRIAAVMGDLSFERITGSRIEKHTPSTVRSQILRHIRTLQKAEEAHSAIKAMNARGQITVMSFKPEDI